MTSICIALAHIWPPVIQAPYFNSFPPVTLGYIDIWMLFSPSTLKSVSHTFHPLCCKYLLCTPSQFFNPFWFTYKSILSNIIQQCTQITILNYFMQLLVRAQSFSAYQSKAHLYSAITRRCARQFPCTRWITFNIYIW
jgi:hypothetical protein